MMIYLLIFMFLRQVVVAHLSYYCEGQVNNVICYFIKMPQTLRLTHRLSGHRLFLLFARELNVLLNQWQLLKIKIHTYLFFNIHIIQIVVDPIDIPMKFWPFY